MNAESQYYSEAFLAVFIAALVSIVLWRRQRKKQHPMGIARATAIFVVAALVALGSLLSLAAATQQVGFGSGKWSQQAIQIAAALIAYFVSAKVLARIHKSSG